MKSCFLRCLLIGVLLAGGAVLAAEPVVAPVAINDLALSGEIQGENIVFTMDFNVERASRKSVVPLLLGDVAYLDGKLPGKAELVRDGAQYVLKLEPSILSFLGGGRQAVTCRFASRAEKDGDWRRTSFQIPAAGVRKISVLCDRDDLEIKFPGALNVQRVKTKEGRAQVTAFLGVSNRFEVAWKPEIRKFESELVATCDAQSLATASVGALRVETMFTYRVIQGRLTKLALALPEVNVTQVQGEDILDWKIDRTDAAHPKLLVTLSRPREDVYRLRVESEMALAQFPCKFNLPALEPENVLRTSGFLAIGTDSAIKLQVTKAAGLTQVDWRRSRLRWVRPVLSARRCRPDPSFRISMPTCPTRWR